MALIKEIELENGVKVNYHRIVSVNNITNHVSIIEVASYTSKEKREQEKEAFAKGKFIDAFKETKFIEKEYEEDLNVVSAYEYLKTLPEFSGCTDD